MRCAFRSCCRCCTTRPIPPISWAKAVAARSPASRRSARKAARRSARSSVRSTARGGASSATSSNRAKAGVNCIVPPRRSKRQPNGSAGALARHSPAIRSAWRAAKRTAWTNSVSLNGLARKCVAPASWNRAIARDIAARYQRQHRTAIGSDRAVQHLGRRQSFGKRAARVDHRYGRSAVQETPFRAFRAPRRDHLPSRARGERGQFVALAE